MINTPITIAGRIVSDSIYLERKDGADGVLKIRVATSRSYRQGDTWHNLDKLFISVEAWGRLGINAHRSLKPGVSVIVQGFLYTNEWELPPAEEGGKAQKRQEIRMRATSIGVDLNHYVVGFQETRPNAYNNPGGIELPDTTSGNYPDVEGMREAKRQTEAQADVRSDGEAQAEDRELAYAGREEAHE